jgi:ribosome-binding factor A
VQKELANRLTTRYVPAVSFVLDKGVKNALEVARLLREARSADAESIAPAEGSTAEDEEE